MQLVDGMVKATNEQLTESTSLLQDILKAAADPQVRRRAPVAAWLLQNKSHDWLAAAWLAG